MAPSVSIPLSKILPNTRLNEIKTFLSDHYLDLAQIDFLAGDASFRKYYRIRHEGQSWVLMDAPPPENPEAFIHVANTLKTHDFSAPHIYGTNLENGFILLEDLGDLTFTQALKQGYNEQTLYELAIDTLIELHTSITQRPDYLPFYSVEDLYREAELLIDWYYPAIYGKKLDKGAVKDYQTLWCDLFEKTMSGPHSLVLRDYHVDNLMVLERPHIQSCGLLDFQDARWGATVYDVVSLLEDARRDIDPTLVDHLWRRYLNAFDSQENLNLRQYAAILSAGRHAKIIGIFTRLAHRDGKDHYLSHIPRVWGHLEKCLTAPELAPLHHWFTTHIPERSVPCPSIKP